MTYSKNFGDMQSRKSESDTYSENGEINNEFKISGNKIKANFSDKFSDFQLLNQDDKLKKG